MPKAPEVSENAWSHPGLRIHGLSFESVAEEGEPVEVASALSSQSELVDAETEEEDEAGEIGFGFWDGYDFGAVKIGDIEVLFKGVSDESRAAAAVEADTCEVGSEI